MPHHNGISDNLTDNGALIRRDDEAIALSPIQRFGTAIDEDNSGGDLVDRDQIHRYRLLLVELPKIAGAIKELPERFQESAYYLLTGLLTEDASPSGTNDDDGD